MEEYLKSKGIKKSFIMQQTGFTRPYLNRILSDPRRYMCVGDIQKLSEVLELDPCFILSVVLK